MEQIPAPEQLAHRRVGRLRKEVPEQQTRENVDRKVRKRDAPYVRKCKSQHDHHHQGMNHRPDHAERGTLVPGPYVAKDQLPEEVAVSNEFLELFDEGHSALRGIVNRITRLHRVA